MYIYLDYNTHNYHRDFTAKLFTALTVVLFLGSQASAISDLPNTLRAARTLEPLLKSIGNGLTVKFGIEVGYYPGIEERLRGMIKGIELDFMIGAIHCLDHICIDSSRECGRYFQNHSAQQYVENYYASVASLINSGMFDSLAHIDVYKKYGRDHYGNEMDDVPVDLLRSVFRMVSDNGIAFEINTAGMRFMNEFYPAPRLMQVAREQGITRVTIGSDSHKPEDLGKDLTRGIEYLKSHGFLAVLRFDKRTPQEEKI